MVQTINIQVQVNGYLFQFRRISSLKKMCILIIVVLKFMEF